MFALSGGPNSVQCRLYPRGNPGGAGTTSYQNCSTPWTTATPPINNGTLFQDWTMEVRVMDAAGNVRVASWNFTTYIIG